MFYTMQFVEKCCLNLFLDTMDVDFCQFFLLKMAIMDVDIRFRQLHYGCRHPNHDFIVLLTGVICELLRSGVKGLVTDLTCILQCYRC